MAPDRREKEPASSSAGTESTATGRHALREQDALWARFLALAALVVDSLEKSVRAICEGQLELIVQVEAEEQDSNRREVEIEYDCLRILALYEPVASDLRRMAAVLKCNRDWERIADLALRVVRKARKLARDPIGLAIPEEVRRLARDVLSQVRSSYQALESRDAELARVVIAGDTAIDQQYQALRRQCKASLAQQPGQVEAWLLLLNLARRLERIGDHAAAIAQTVVYLREGTIARRTNPDPDHSVEP
ncbi:MAG: phosphate signaling complex protein PhoU [Isosphaeraceae bacterium]